jgi:hypothetical protein
MDDHDKWYLLKNDDGALFGPISFEQLREWATDAQVSPLDKVSQDERNWVKAPMVPELAMDYLVEVSPDQFYGPTTLGAVREFLVAGEIKVSEFPELQIAEEPVDDTRPVRTSIRVNLQQRIRDLEEALMEERRAREQAEHLLEKLETKLAEINRAAAL